MFDHSLINLFISCLVLDFVKKVLDMVEQRVHSVAHRK